MADTAAKVDMVITNNATWMDAFQFGTVGDTSWNFTGQNFRMDIKGNKDQTVALLTLLSTNGTIVVDDVTQRILHLNVPDATITGALVPGEYQYDFIMYDSSNPVVRVLLMQGEIKVRQGVTGN